jgi:hypothetical protein
VNDSKEDAHRLVELLRGIPAKVNLIPFNEWPGAPYKRSSGNRIHAFADIIHNAGYASPIRTPRGEDIMAACGQLKSATERARKGRAVVAADQLEACRRAVGHQTADLGAARAVEWRRVAEILKKCLKTSPFGENLV